MVPINIKDNTEKGFKEVGSCNNSNVKRSRSFEKTVYS